MKMFNDMFEAVDLDRNIILITLDLSIAFDTIDHSILLKRLESSFGETGYALSWVRLCLTDRISFIKVANASSAVVFCNTGVQRRICFWAFTVLSLSL